MAQLIINNNEYAADFRSKVNDNFTELYNNTAPLNHASVNDTYGLGSNTHYGHLKIQATNGLNVNAGVVSLSLASDNNFGSVKLAKTAMSTSATDVVTSKILNDTMRGGNTISKIFYGVGDPTSSNPSGAIDGDIYIKYV